MRNLLANASDAQSLDGSRLMGSLLSPNGNCRNRRGCAQANLWFVAGPTPEGCHLATPIRAISHSSLTPECSSTLRRTCSPRSSISAAVALPRLIRKLQCISDPCAPPLVNPRQPAASINCQALRPGGVLEVETPGGRFSA